MISLNDYANLRSYAGSETAVMLENRYHHGVFTRDDADTTSQDNGVTLIVDAQNRRWKRIINDGDYSIDWWHLPGDELDYSLTITRACNFLQVKGEEWWQLPIPTTPAGITLVGPGGVRPCKTTANLKLWKNAVDFKGTILDFSGATNIECVRVQYSLGAPAIYNLRIVGAPGAAANLRGLCVYSDASNMHGLPACQLLVQNVWLTNLYKGIVFGNNAYIQSWHSIMVRGCFWPIWSETTANAGEKIVFYKCLFGDSRNYYQGCTPWPSAIVRSTTAALAMKPNSWPIPTMACSTLKAARWTLKIATSNGVTPIAATTGRSLPATTAVR